MYEDMQKDVGAKRSLPKTDSEKLRLLADWFDIIYPDDPNPEIQKDLRRMADEWEAIDIDEVMFWINWLRQGVERAKDMIIEEGDGHDGS